MSARVAGADPCREFGLSSAQVLEWASRVAGELRLPPPQRGLPLNHRQGSLVSAATFALWRFRGGKMLSSLPIRWPQRVLQQ